MTDFEKIEKLRQHADVTFEEAKQALDAADGDILDAMIWLENHGKAKRPSESVHSTKYEDQPRYTSVSEQVMKAAAQDKESSTWSKVKVILKRVWGFFSENYFVISKNGRDVVVLPFLVVLLALIFLFIFSIITLVVLLFFGFHYSFRGKNDLGGANEVMDKAADAASGFADKVKREFNEREYSDRRR